MNYIIGLGNPGKEYENTRHNAGAQVIDYLIAVTKDLKYSRLRVTSAMVWYTLHEFPEHRFIRPLGYMNSSGSTIKANFVIRPEDKFIVIHDDLYLPVGEVRYKTKPSAHGGHNGVKSILNTFPDHPVYRIKIGIDKPEESSKYKDYVLEPFTPEEQKKMNLLIPEVYEKLFEKLRAGEFQ